MTASVIEPGATSEGNWRSIILFGRNVASYKFALSKTLIEAAAQERTSRRQGSMTRRENACDEGGA